MAPRPREIAHQFAARDEPSRSLFGLTIVQPPRLLTGDDLLHEMLGG